MAFHLKGPKHLITIIKTVETEMLGFDSMKCFFVFNILLNNSSHKQELSQLFSYVMFNTMFKEKEFQYKKKHLKITCLFKW